MNGEEGDENSSDSGSDAESEYDFNIPPMSPVSEACYEDVELARTGNDNSPTIPTSVTAENCLSDNRINGSDTGDDSNLSSAVPVNHTSNNDGAMSLDPSTAFTNPTVGIGVENNQLEQTSSAPPNRHGFKLVGDNIDKNVRPSFSRSDKKTQSLHCFHYYATLDRVNLSSFSDVTPGTQVDADKLLINHGDIAQLQSDAITLISR